MQVKYYFGALVIFILGIIIGLLLYKLFGNKSKIYQQSTGISLGIFLISGLMVFGYAIFLFFSSDGGIKELAPIGILLGAFIASASVMRSIRSQWELETTKQKMNVIDAINTLLTTVVKTEEIRHDDLMSFVNKTRRAKIVFNDIRLVTYINDIHDQAVKLNQICVQRAENLPKLDELEATFDSAHDEVLSRSNVGAEYRKRAEAKYMTDYSKKKSKLEKPIQQYASEHPELMEWFKQTQIEINQYLDDLI